MNIIGVEVFVAKILAHLSPPVVARMRFLNKDICARISAGPYARMFWRHESYQDFVSMVTWRKKKHIRYTVKWFWNIDQYMKFYNLAIPRTIRNCIYAKIIPKYAYGNVNSLQRKLPAKLVFALIEDLCTFDEVLKCDNNIMINYGFKSEIIPALLRKRKCDVMKYFRNYSNHQKDQFALLFKCYLNLPFSTEKVLEYCISKGVQFPFVLISAEVCANIQKGIWTWKEVVDYCIENRGGGETTIGIIITEGYGNMKFQEALALKFSDRVF